MSRDILVLLIVLSSGCATLSNRTKGFGLTGLAIAGGAATGALTAPQNERAELHGVLWGAVAGLATSIVSQFIFDEKANSDELDRQNKILKKELEQFRPETASTDQPLASTEGFARMNDALPENIKGLVRAGKWRHTKFGNDHWIQKGDQYLVRECEAFTLIPPSIQVPSNLTTNQSEKKGEQNEKQ